METYLGQVWVRRVRRVRWKIYMKRVFWRVQFIIIRNEKENPRGTFVATVILLIAVKA